MREITFPFSWEGIHALKRGDAPKNITDIVKNLPLDKLDKVEAMLQQLKEED